jgi:hypothetical protein
VKPVDITKKLSKGWADEVLTIAKWNEQKVRSTSACASICWPCRCHHSLILALLVNHSPRSLSWSSWRKALPKSRSAAVSSYSAVLTSVCSLHSFMLCRLGRHDRCYELDVQARQGEEDAHRRRCRGSSDAKTPDSASAQGPNLFLARDQIFKAVTLIAKNARKPFSHSARCVHSARYESSFCSGGRIACRLCFVLAARSCRW